jgi:hypothetical protein
MSEDRSVEGLPAEDVGISIRLPSEGHDLARRQRIWSLARALPFARGLGEGGGEELLGQAGSFVQRDRFRSPLPIVERRLLGTRRRSQ